MSSTFCAEKTCGRPVHSTTLCTDHLAELAMLLEQTYWVIDQLRVVTTKQQRFSTARITSSEETPLPYHPTATAVALEYATTVLRWQARVADHLGLPVRYPSAIAASIWLTYALPRLNAYVDAGKMLAELDRAHSAALRLINKPADKWYAGICSATLPDGTECQRDLYADTETGVILCPLCGTQHTVQARRAVLMAAALDHLATATEIARAMTVWTDYDHGQRALVKRINTWVARGRLTQRGTTTVGGQQRPLYRVGDVKDLADTTRRETSRATG